MYMYIYIYIYIYIEQAAVFLFLAGLLEYAEAGVAYIRDLFKKKTRKCYYLLVF